MKNLPLVESDVLTQFCSDYRAEAIDLLQSTRRTYGNTSNFISHFLFPLGDRMAKKWLQETNNCYFEEIKEFDQIVNLSGIWALNISYEWGCTSGVYQTEEAPDLLRILDWPFSGLGRNAFVIHQRAKGGDFFNITWPGMAGVFQATAPGRFAAAINQAPMRQHGLFLLGDWLKNRKMMFKQRSLPPSHLLRQVFTTAVDYEEAKERLTKTPICLPVIYILSGMKKGEGCIIERLEDSAAVRELGEQKSVSVSNHFQTSLHQQARGWLPRAIDSAGRAKQICDLDYQGFASPHFDWLTFPMINRFTRLSMLANAKTQRLKAQGWEATGAVTHVFNV